MSTILNLYNQSSPESVLAHKLIISLQRLDSDNVIINNTHGNVIRKFPHVIFDKINLFALDVPSETLQLLLECSPGAKITIYRDTNSNIYEWPAEVLSELEADMFEIYGDISPCQQAMHECERSDVWVAKHTLNEIHDAKEHVFATANHFRFKKTSENFRNRIDSGFGDESVAREIVKQNICYKDGIAMCNVSKQQSWEVARFLSFSKEQFLLYEDTSNKRIFWTYGLTREFIKSKYQPQDIWSHGVMLSFSLPKDALLAH